VDKTNWKGRRISDPAHHNDLEAAAANYEFGATRLDRAAAEEAAYSEYKRTQHVSAIGHHAHAVRSAVSAGLRDEAEKHNALYGLHMKALGFKPSATPPPSAMVQQSHKDFGKFKPHPADQLLVGSSMSKSERADFFKYVDSDASFLSEPESEDTELSKSLKSPMALEQLDDQKVRVYFNLHNRLFSVMHGRRVVAHVPRVKLKNVTFKVSEAGRQRVLNEERKNVHAFVEGTFEHFTDGEPELLPEGVTYNPYKHSTFIRTKDKSPIHSAKEAVLTNTPYPMVTVVEEAVQESHPSFIHRRGQNG
jgi:hypothetical protein